MRWIVLCASALFAVVSAQKSGPCTLNSQGLTCTRNGYFEMTQCTSKDCFCVSVHTGAIAEETRTGAPRKLPTCSRCHLKLRDVFSSSSSPSSSVYVPTCDNKKGDYTAVQCHPARRECWCVEPVSGEEMKGSRKPHTNVDILQCAPTTGVVNGRFPSVLNYKRVEYPVARVTCKLTMDRGSRCSGKAPSVQYYFDTEHADCFAFEYLGCGGNDNRYPTKRDCHGKCNLPDMSGCSGMVEPKGTCNPNEQNWAPPPPPGSPTTPKPVAKPLCATGYSCHMGAFFGFCCPDDVEALYNKEYNPTCPNGARAHTDNNGDWDETRLGRKCADNFCPSSKTCKQGTLFAYCC